MLTVGVVVLRHRRRRGLLGSFLAGSWAPPPSRIIPFVVVKRTDSHLGRTYGHWWVELDGVESYGWWPDHCPVRIRDMLRGCTGTLNGVGGSCGGGSIISDPYHGEPADHWFHPTLTVRKSDRAVRREIRAFALGYRGAWRWSTKAAKSLNCRSFQLQMLQAVGLSDEGHIHTRGRGCPFLSPWRRLQARPRLGRGVQYVVGSGIDRLPGAAFQAGPIRQRSAPSTKRRMWWSKNQQEDRDRPAR